MSSEEQRNALKKKLEARKNGGVRSNEKYVEANGHVNEAPGGSLPDSRGIGVDGYGNPKLIQVLNRPIMGREMSWLAYAFSWLGIIAVALGCNRKDAYVKRHLNNALGCNLIGTISMIVLSVCQGIMVAQSARYFYSYGSSSRGQMIIVICGLLAIICAICALFSVIMLILGWLSALRGQTRSLPIIGRMNFFK